MHRPHRSTPRPGGSHMPRLRHGPGRALVMGRRIAATSYTDRRSVSSRLRVRGSCAHTPGAFARVAGASTGRGGWQAARPLPGRRAAVGLMWVWTSGSLPPVFPPSSSGTAVCTPREWARNGVSRSAPRRRRSGCADMSCARRHGCCAEEHYAKLRRRVSDNGLRDGSPVEGHVQETATRPHTECRCAQEG